MKKNNYLFLFFRYLVLLLIAIPKLYLFYLLLTPLTVYFSYFLIKVFYSSAILVENSILISNYSLEIIGACVAASAYYFLLILNLSTPNINIMKRLKILLFSFAILFIFNICRILFLSILVVNNFYLFDIIHKFIWYFVSTFFVIILWFFMVKRFNIKEISFYSDLKFLYKNSRFVKW